LFLFLLQELFLLTNEAVEFLLALCPHSLHEHVLDVRLLGCHRDDSVFELDDLVVDELAGVSAEFVRLLVLQIEFVLGVGVPGRTRVQVLVHELAQSLCVLFVLLALVVVGVGVVVFIQSLLLQLGVQQFLDQLDAVGVHGEETGVDLRGQQLPGVVLVLASEEGTEGLECACVLARLAEHLVVQEGEDQIQRVLAHRALREGVHREVLNRVALDARELELHEDLLDVVLGDFHTFVLPVEDLPTFFQQLGLVGAREELFCGVHHAHDSLDEVHDLNWVVLLPFLFFEGDFAHDVQHRFECRLFGLWAAHAEEEGGVPECEVLQVAHEGFIVQLDAHGVALHLPGLGLLLPPELLVHVWVEGVHVFHDEVQDV